MTQVLVSFAQSDLDTIRNKVLPNLVSFIKLVNPDKQVQLLSTLIRPILEDQPKKPTLKHSVAKVKLM
jgi:hypothetical protein